MCRLLRRRWATSPRRGVRAGVLLQLAQREAISRYLTWMCWQTRSWRMKMLWWRCCQAHGQMCRSHILEPCGQWFSRPIHGICWFGPRTRGEYASATCEQVSRASRWCRSIRKKRACGEKHSKTCRRPDLRIAWQVETAINSRTTLCAGIGMLTTTRQR